MPHLLEQSFSKSEPIIYVFGRPALLARASGYVHSLHAYSRTHACGAQSFTLNNLIFIFIATGSSPRQGSDLFWTVLVLDKKFLTSTSQINKKKKPSQFDSLKSVNV